MHFTKVIMGRAKLKKVSFKVLWYCSCILTFILLLLVLHSAETHFQPSYFNDKTDLGTCWIEKSYQIGIFTWRCVET